MLKSLFLLSLIIFFNGCITKRNVTRGEQGTNVIEVRSKNFNKNEMKSSFVGQVMLEEKNYSLKKELFSTMSPKVAFDLYGPLGIHLYGNPSLQYDILGTTMIDNQKFTVLAYNSKQDKYHGRKILVDKNNILFNKILVGKDNIEVTWDLTIYPRIVMFEKQVNKKEIILKEKQYVNYQLLYSGIENDIIHLTYREFASDNLTKTSFSQNLVYPRGEKFLYFKDKKIKVHNISNNQIKFSLL